LWSSSANYDADQLSHVPRRIAVSAGKMTRCGLFAASTYPRPLPDAVMSNYLQYCQYAAIFQTAPQKGLDSARKVVAAAPDFSWGWSAVALAAMQSQWSNRGPARDELRQIGLNATGKALSLDPKNSEALWTKSALIDSSDYVGQEKLLKQAIAARPLDCGCEHYIYGLMLENVGRYADAVEEFRRAIDMMALDDGSQFTLADSLAVTGRPDEAKPHFAAAIDLSSTPDFAPFIAIAEAPETGDYRKAILALQDPEQQLPHDQHAALLAAFEAKVSGDRGAQARAVQLLLALPKNQQDPWTTKMLGVLGAHHEALMALASNLHSRSDWPSLLWYPSMRGVLSDPDFPALAQRLGLMRYWKTTHIKPDVCSEKGAPPFCRMI
jgi:tetratricopeptide (TPR) repeat protein